MSNLRHPLEPHLRPDVFAPGEALPAGGVREPIFGPGLPWFIGLAAGVFVNALAFDGSMASRFIGPIIGAAIVGLLQAIDQR